VIHTIIAAVRSHGYPHHGTPWGLIPAVHPTIVSRVWTRLTRAEAAIKSLMARFRAGTLAPSKPRGKRANTRTRTPSDLKPLPSGFAWLCPLVPNKASIYGNHLMLVLAEPEMQDLIAASPRAVQILKPVCRMLGIDPRVLTPKPILTPERGNPLDCPASPTTTAIPPESHESAPANLESRLEPWQLRPA
jgi:hypothetical protein